MTLLIHGIADAEEAGGLDLDVLSSVRGDEVSLVAAGDPPHAALVSEVPDAEVLPTRHLLLGHARLLEQVGESMTVLPLRFGTTAPTARELRDGYLASAGPELRRRVELLRGQAEWRVRGRYDETTTLREIATSDRRIARLRGRTNRSSQIELGERVVAALEGRRVGDERRATQHLETHVSAIEPNTVREPLEAFSLSVLVRREDTATFESRLDDLAQELAPTIVLELLGPQPPYSFVGEEPAWVS